MTTSKGFLLDTCAIIWLTQGEHVDEDAKIEIERAFKNGVLVGASVMSSWEIGMLISKGRLASNSTPHRWFDDFVKVSGVKIEVVSPKILIDSSFLPRPVPNDPIDRILIATARERDLTLVTRDSKILATGAAGHVRTLEC
jgi:PIN domain nuclease of toxin-antitoxin system